jgi:hypothetical protein
VDEGLQILTAFHVGVILIALVGLWAARRWPGVVSLVILIAVVGGFGLVWLGAYTAEDDLDAGRHRYQAGIAMLFYGLPACVLVALARQRTGDTVGPIGFRGWAEAIGTYLIACWFTAFLLGCIAMFGMAQAGSFR